MDMQPFFDVSEATLVRTKAKLKAKKKDGEESLEVPMSAEDYLVQVRVENEVLPSTCLAPGYTDSLTSNEPTTSSNAAMRSLDPYAAPLEWQLHEVHMFECVRERMAVRAHYAMGMKADKTNTRWETLTELPPLSDKQMWRCILTENGANERTVDAPPLLSIVLRLRQYDVLTLIDYCSEWLAEACDEMNSALAEKIARWLYSCMTVLDTPIEPGAAASLRDVVRSAKQMRQTLTAMSGGSKEDTLRPYSLLICIVARFFGQMDLVDA